MEKTTNKEKTKTIITIPFDISIEERIERNKRNGNNLLIYSTLAMLVGIIFYPLLLFGIVGFITGLCTRLSAFKDSTELKVENYLNQLTYNQREHLLITSSTSDHSITTYDNLTLNFMDPLIRTIYFNE